MGSIGPQGLGPNGAYSSVGLSNPHFAAMASSQNLPAVLNDPRKGELLIRQFSGNFMNTKMLIKISMSFFL